MTAPRTVTVAVWRGGTMTMPCPPWCIGHTDAQVAQHPVDFHHDGPETGVTVETAAGRDEILAAGITQAPLGSRDCLPYASVDTGGGYERMEPDQLRGLADGLEAHAVFLRRFAVEVEELRAVTAEEYRPAGIPPHLPPLAPLDGDL
ncbi:DUF6907 domain-containing protein [Streptacidiphilus albus]|uniref:DUF6907 domain-containing protein n=1 Tax=Streptacidiphilus albus TaxID=105425 RepID=UPI00054C5273|nr:hypothetical protein [Streptacidiphilus albus]